MPEKPDRKSLNTAAETGPAAPTDASAAAAGPREPVGRVKFVQSPHPVEDSYADGVTGVMARGHVVKLDLYRVVGYEKDTRDEMRTISHRIVLPVSAVAELITVLQGVVEARQQAGQRGTAVPSSKSAAPQATGNS